jgi:hypothetical protein
MCKIISKKIYVIINMNLNFTEIDDLGNNDNFNVNGYQTNNYWETSNVKAQEPKKKKINYNDILNSLNLVVNKSGVLQYITTTDNQDQQEQQQYYNPQQQQPSKGKPLDPQVKNSHIFNKYFKDYKDPNAEYVEEVKVPQTIEEYNQMLLEDRIKRIQERNRVSQIKSTKLLFESNNNSNNGFINNGNNGNGRIGVSKNTLRMMKFN